METTIIYILCGINYLGYVFQSPRYNPYVEGDITPP